MNTGGSDRTSLWRGSGTGLGANISRHENHFPQCIETQPVSYSEATSSANTIVHGNVGASNVSSDLGSYIPVRTASILPS